MNRQTLFLLAILLATGLPASAASFALDIFDGADFTGNVVGQATLSTTTGYPQVDTPGNPAVVPPPGTPTTVVVPQLDQHDFTLTLDSLNPGYSGVNGLSVTVGSNVSLELSAPYPEFWLVDPAISDSCASLSPATDPCTERPVMPQAPAGWSVSIEQSIQDSIDTVVGPTTVLRSAFAIFEFQFTADNAANALAVGDSLPGFRFKTWATDWDLFNDDPTPSDAAARGLMATGEEPAPVPEPAAFTLVALGLAALLSARRNRHPNGQTR